MNIWPEFGVTETEDKIWLSTVVRTFDGEYWRLLKVDANFTIDKSTINIFWHGVMLAFAKRVYDAQVNETDKGEIDNVQWSERVRLGVPNAYLDQKKRRNETPL